MRWPGLVGLPIQFAVGIGEGLWGIAKALPAAAEMSIQGWSQALSDPALAGKALMSGADELYQAVVGVVSDPKKRSAMSPAVAAHADAAVKAFKENPGRASGRLVADVATLLFPSASFKVAKDLVGAVRGIPAGVSAARRAAPAQAASEAVTSVAPVARVEPGTSQVTGRYPGLRRVSEQIQAAERAARAEKAAPVAQDLVVPATVEEALPAVREAVRRSAARERAKRLRPSPVAAPGVSPAPAPAPAPAPVPAPAPAPVVAPVVAATTEAVAAESAVATPRTAKVVEDIARQKAKAGGRKARRAAAPAAPVEGPVTTAPIVQEEIARAPEPSPIPAPPAPVVTPVTGAPRAPAEVAPVLPSATFTKKGRVKKLSEQIKQTLTPEPAAPPVKKEPSVKIERGLPERVPGSGIEFQRVESATISEIGYDPASREFGIKFVKKPGQTYVYADVEPAVAETIFGAESKGKAFNDMLRGRESYLLQERDIGVKAASERALDLLAEGRTMDQVVKAMRPVLKKVSPDINPTAFVKKIIRGLPEDPEQFAAWAQRYRSAKRVAVETAPATEVRPERARDFVEEVTGTSSAKTEPVVADAAAAKREAELLGGDDFERPPIISGGQELPKIHQALSGAEIFERLMPEFGHAVVRARTIADEIRSPMRFRLRGAGYESINPRGPDDRMLYDAMFRGAQPSTQAVSQALKEAQSLGFSASPRFFHQVTSVDIAKVRRLGPRELTSLFVRDGAAPEVASAFAQRLYDATIKSGSVRKLFTNKNALIAPYEIIYPVKHSLARWLDEAANLRGVSDVFGSPEQFQKLALYLAKPLDVTSQRIVMNSVRKILGKPDFVDIDPTARLVRDVGRFFSAFSSLALSPITTVKQAGQMAYAAMNLPLKDVAVGFFKMFSPSAVRDVKMTGATLTEIRELAGLLFTAAEDSTWFGRAAEAISERWTKKAINWMQIPAMDNMSRVFSFLGRRSELTGLYEAAQFGNQRAIRRLQKYGIDLTSPDIAQEIQRASVEFSHRYNLRSDFLSSPYFLSQPVGQFARGLQMFAINTTKLMYREFINSRGSTRWVSLPTVDAMIKLGRFAGYGTLIGAVINNAESLMRGEELPTSAASQVFGAISAIGSLGLFDRMWIGMIDPDTGDMIDVDEWPRVIGQNLGEIVRVFPVGAGPGVMARMIKGTLTLDPGVVPHVGPLLKRRLGE